MSRVYRATVKGHEQNGALVMPGFHYQTDLPPLGGEPDPADVASALWSHIGTAALAATPNTIIIDELVVTEEVLPPDVGVAGSHTVATAGTLAGGSGNQLPDGIACVLDRHTATRSRSSRGWTMWPGPASSSQLLHNVFTSAYLISIDALCALLDDDFTVGLITPTTVHPVVYSKTRRQRLETPFTFQVTSVTSNDVPTWLRSRMDVP